MKDVGRWEEWRKTRLKQSDSGCELAHTFVFVHDCHRQERQFFVVVVSYENDEVK